MTTWKLFWSLYREIGLFGEVTLSDIVRFNPHIKRGELPLSDIRDIMSNFRANNESYGVVPLVSHSEMAGYLKKINAQLLTGEKPVPFPAESRLNAPRVMLRTLETGDVEVEVSRAEMTHFLKKLNVNLTSGNKEPGTSYKIKNTVPSDDIKATLYASKPSDNYNASAASYYELVLSQGEPLGKWTPLNNTDDSKAAHYSHVQSTANDEFTTKYKLTTTATCADTVYYDEPNEQPAGSLNTQSKVLVKVLPPATTEVFIPSTNNQNIDVPAKVKKNLPKKARKPRKPKKGTK